MAMQQQATKTKTTWTFDPAHTQVEFSTKHMMVTTVRGHFADVSGKIVGDLEDPTDAQVEVEIKTASIDTRNQQREDHLKSADFLDVEKYPTITFKSKQIQQVSKNHFHVYGDLTIKGVTKEVELDAAVNGVGKTPYGQEIVGITAETVLTRQDWGLTWNVALESGGVLVGNTVKVLAEVEAIKSPAGQEQAAQS
ncbi:MAG TPA: YceI family protein [Chloroflexota bacterium]|nr:YceI family protein [Chloroflexota bacterium]